MGRFRRSWADSQNWNGWILRTTGCMGLFRRSWAHQLTNLELGQLKHLSNKLSGTIPPEQPVDPVDVYPEPGERLGTTTLTGLASLFASRRSYASPPKCQRLDVLPITVHRPLRFHNSVLGRSLVGSTKGTRTTSASTMPSAGSWTLTWVPRFQWERGRTARAMFEPWVGDQKALVT